MCEVPQTVGLVCRETVASISVAGRHNEVVGARRAWSIWRSGEYSLRRWVIGHKDDVARWASRVLIVPESIRNVCRETIASVAVARPDPDRCIGIAERGLAVIADTLGRAWATR